MDGTGSRAPINCRPVGLISWFSDAGEPLALTTPWVAVIPGPWLRLRAAWPIVADDLAAGWSGGDFVVNLLPASGPGPLSMALKLDRICLDIDKGLRMDWTESLRVRAPRLPGCPLQIECTEGGWVGSHHESDVAGRVVLLHRAGEVVSAEDGARLCAAGCLWVA